MGLTGEAAQVCIGSAVPDGDDLFFLNTFSVGLYPEMVHRREKRERKQLRKSDSKALPPGGTS